jgi:hypothetical protein
VPGLELNEHLWEYVDEVGGDAETYAEAFEAMADRLAEGDFSDLNNGAFLTHCGEYMRDWLDCLDELDALEPQPVPADD